MSRRAEASANRDAVSDEYATIRAQWFAHVDNEEQLFLPQSDDDKKRYLDAVMATLTEDCEFRLPTGECWTGQQSVREYYEFFLSAFDGMKWQPQAVVIGPQGVLDVARMKATQRKPIGALKRVDADVEVQWVINWPWDPQSAKFTGETICILQYVD